MGPAVGIAVADLVVHDAPHPARPVALVEHAPFDGGHQSPTAAPIPAEGAQSRLRVVQWDSNSRNRAPILCP